MLTAGMVMVHRAQDFIRSWEYCFIGGLDWTKQTGLATVTFATRDPLWTYSSRWYQRWWQLRLGGMAAGCRSFPTTHWNSRSAGYRS
ncbi:hypothetical protein OOU_Y34scaffold00753g6 [Pyricularia oryzae Y34]|uniref:Uncharacterized protein n=2 Tax=Pyricularia oryzae TaxID=318829 RepID=A0AA97NQR0_PYRO3|nr:hypothetical protein OOU_Y34scaffold00753g6 [Pyricularia oryzae Y34]